jgi:hypothetical protein
MLIAIYSIFIATSIMTLFGLFIYFFTVLIGLLSVYWLSLIESFIGRTITFVPILIPPIQTLILYCTFALDVLIVLLAMWVNIRYYELMTFLTGPYLFVKTWCIWYVKFVFMFIPAPIKNFVYRRITAMGDLGN